jgi:putative aldouronate transport system permease protein
MQANMIFRAYGVTVFITVVGTFANLLFSTLLAYPMSRKDMPFRKTITFIVFFTLLFSGGLVPTYMTYTEIFHIKNTIWSLIVPNLLVNGFYVLIMRTYFTVNIPEEVIESATIDGAGEFRTFVKIILPLSLPILATIGLFAAVRYWNDWFNGLIFLTDHKLFSIQNLLNRMLSDIQFLSNNNQAANSVITNMPSSTVKMAIAVIGAIPILAVYPFFQKYFVKGITIGAVKG